MHKKIVRIIANENKNNIEPFYRSCEYHHLQGIRQFIYHCELNLDEQLLDSMQASKLLASLGFCVMLSSAYDDIENIEIFIPEQISKKQLEYFNQEKMQQKLAESNLVLYKLTKESSLEITSKSITKEPIINELMKELNERLELAKTTNKSRKLIKNEIKNN